MKELQIGDKIRMINTFNNNLIIIHRVTKTMAFGKIGDSKYEYKFKRSYYDPKLITSLPRERFSMTSYKLES